MSTYLIVSGEFLLTGGQDRANYALASYFARQGHRVHLVAHEVAGELLREGDVEWHRAPKPLNSTLLGEPFLQRIGTSVAQKLAREDARVITNGGNCDWPADVNWVHYVHAAYERVPHGAARKVRYHVAHRRFVANERRALSRSRVVLANSRRTARDLERFVHVEHSTMRVIYYGVETAPSAPAASPLQRAGSDVLFVGSLADTRKGVDTVLSAWQILCTDPTWNATLLVVGGGADVARWRSLIGRMRLSDRIRFLGFRTDVPELMRSAAALLSPTRYEPYGLGVHEALCGGVPAIVSACAGVAERYPDDLKHLLLPDPEDAEDLARRLRACLSPDPQQRESLARFAAELRSRTWDDMAADVERVIEESRGAPTVSATCAGAV